MLATLSGMFIDVRPRQNSKALSPMLVTLAGMTVFLHPKTKLLSIVFIMALQLLRLSYTLFPFATTIDVRPLQPEKVFIPILVTPSGIFISVRLLHPQKATAPMLVTLAGMFIDVRLLQL